MKESNSQDRQALRMEFSVIRNGDTRMEVAIKRKIRFRRLAFSTMGDLSGAQKVLGIYLEGASSSLSKILELKFNVYISFIA